MCCLSMDILYFCFLYVCYRSAAFAIIAISRMTFIMRRWHSGVRNLSHINSRYIRPTHHRIPTSKPPRPPSNLFQSGQPVSPTNFLTNVRESAGRMERTRSDPQENKWVPARPKTPTNAESLPWSGFSPPSKDEGPGTSTKRNP